MRNKENVSMCSNVFTGSLQPVSCHFSRNQTFVVWRNWTL